MLIIEKKIQVYFWAMDLKDLIINLRSESVDRLNCLWSGPKTIKLITLAMEEKIMKEYNNMLKLKQIEKADFYTRGY